MIRSQISSKQFLLWLQVFLYANDWMCVSYTACIGNRLYMYNWMLVCSPFCDDVHSTCFNVEQHSQQKHILVDPPTIRSVCIFIYICACMHSKKKTETNKHTLKHQFHGSHLPNTGTCVWVLTTWTLVKFRCIVLRKNNELLSSSHSRRTPWSICCVSCCG